ncbi:MAG: hypothetical protein MJ086_02720 [Lachnospiraceae bacterium]|nr:hypothetical protein [Lachnospiraceae bacterium]
MDKKTKDSLLNIAAELVVSPLRVYAAAKELKEKLDADGTNDKIKAYVNDFGAKAKEFGEKAGEKAKAYGDKAEEKAREYSAKAKDVFEDFGEDAKKFGDDFTAKVKEFADSIDGKDEEEEAMDDDLDAIILDAVNKEDSEEEE